MPSLRIPGALRPPLATRSLAVLALLACCVRHPAGLSAAETQAAGPRPPNIVVFLVDDMGIMDTSLPFLTDPAGMPQRFPLNDFYRTPHMERLAMRGIRFNQFCAMSVCSPTRVSIMTGQNAARHRVTNWIHPDQDNRGPAGPVDWNWLGLNSRDVTLPGLLRAAGYRTIHLGKGHFGPRHAEGADPLRLGFDINIGGCSIGAPASYLGQKNYGNAAVPDRQAVPHLEKYHGTDTFLTEALTLEACAQIRASAAAGQPFFLHLAHYAVHAPFNSDPRFAEHYRASGKPPAAQAFATLIEGMDKSLGDLLDQLEAAGVAEDTLVIFLGDNGSDAPLGHQHEVACAAPLRGRKGAHYEGGMRVPLIVAWAQPDTRRPHQQQWTIAQGAIQPALASVPDLFPTILEVAGVTAPVGHTVDGQSLTQLLKGQPDPAHRDEFLMHYPHAPHRSDYFTSYRSGPWKVIYHYFPSEASEHSHYQLFHLGNDPFESTNLAATHRDELQAMMSRMITSLQQHQAVYPHDGDQQLLPLLPVD
jgi:arylsulfatase A-like enzyme